MKSLIRDRYKAAFTAGTAYAATASATGADAGTVPNGTHYVAGTSADANHIILLPVLLPGEMCIVTNKCGTAFELRTATPASIFLNGAAADKEVAIADNKAAICFGVDATNVICMTVDMPDAD